jgi:hypothetical protein
LPHTGAVLVLLGLYLLAFGCAAWLDWFSYRRLIEGIHYFIDRMVAQWPTNKIDFDLTFAQENGTYNIPSAMYFW